MTKTWGEFSTYAVIGIANTLVHWLLFFVLRITFDLNQASSNFLAFCLAASFSFYANATFTFTMPASPGRYLTFVACLGGLSLATGSLADRWHFPGIVTLIGFSLISLVPGFLVSKWLVFRVRAS